MSTAAPLRSARRGRAALVRARLAVVASCVTALVVLVPMLSVRADADPADDVAPALDTDVPDPMAIIHDGRVVVLSTNASPGGTVRNVPAWTWTVAEGWKVIGDALPVLPAWTTPGRVWAPGAGQRPDGTWSLYFTSRHNASGRQCIGHAVADDPAGPYRPVGSAPVVCDIAEGGSIDASVHVEGAQRWLLWKTDANVVGRPTTVKSVRLTDEGVPTGPVSILLRSERRWEHGVIENPELVRGRKGLVLVYSAGRFGDTSYATGTATCASPAGPCTRTGDTPDLATRGSLVGPGGASLARSADGALHLFFHSWQDGVGYGNGAHRALRTQAVDVDTGRIRFRADASPIGRPDDRPRLQLRRHAAAPVDSGLSLRFGDASGQFLACDLDGTGVDRIVWFQAGTWLRSDRTVGDADSLSTFGAAGDRGFCGDFDGDRRDDRAVFRRGALHVAPSNGTSHRRIPVPEGDVPLVGDWDGDGTDDVGVWSPGVFTLRTDEGRRAVRFSPISGGTPVAGDWDGDGLDDVGLFRDGRFHLRTVLMNTTFYVGAPTDLPLVGRWDKRLPTSGVGVVAA